MKVSSSLIRWGLLVLLYKALLDLVYHVVIPGAGYYAVPLVHFNLLKFVESYLLTMLVFATIPKDPKRLSSLLAWMLTLISYMPMLTVYAFADESPLFVYLVTIFWLAVFSLLKFLPTARVRSLKASQARISFVGTIAALAGLSLFLIVRYLGLSFLLNLSEVYAVRSKFIESGVPLKGYPLHWMATAVNPILFAMVVVRKKWVAAGLIALSQVVIGSAVGLRSYFLILPFVGFLIWAASHEDVFSYLAWGLSSVILVTLVTFGLTGNAAVPLLLVVRPLLVPARLNFLYYHYFSANGFWPFVYACKFYLKLPCFQDPSYDIDPANLIGLEFFNQPDLGAVTGIAGDAYMNLGAAGLILWGAALVMLCKLLDGVTRGLDMRVGAAAIAFAAISISGTYLIRALVTGGVIITLFLLYMLPKRQAGGVP